MIKTLIPDCQYQLGNRTNEDSLVVEPGLEFN